MKKGLLILPLSLSLLFPAILSAENMHQHPHHTNTMNGKSVNHHMHSQMNKMYQAKNIDNGTSVNHHMHSQMDEMYQAKNIDEMFVIGMKAHHQGAIEMSDVLLQKGKDQELITLAKNIKKAQQPEIDSFDTWLTKFNQQKNINKNDKDLAKVTKLYRKSMQIMHDLMEKASLSDDPDYAFAAGMLAHHQGAIEMSDVELKYGKDKSLIKMAKEIKENQLPEIKQLTQWLNKYK